MTTKFSVPDAPRSIRTVLLLFIVTCCIVAAPALADTKYIGGAPNLTAYLSGVNEFTAGSDITIPIVIENSGFYQYEQVDTNTVAPDDLPTTAKFVTINLSAGNAPIVIKSDSQMIGDMLGQTTSTVEFSATINADAPAGTYMLPLEINYTTLSSVNEQDFISTEENQYQQNTLNLTVPFVIKAEVVPQVVSAVPDNLVAGADGYINLTVMNVGSLDGSKATVRLVQTGESPIVPIDSGVYVGDFPVGSTASCTFKVSVDQSAVNKDYPVGVVINYQNNEGDFVDSRTVTTGVDVGNKVSFAIISPTITLSPGSKGTIQVEYKNTGDSTVRGAEARISAITPFTISASVAYLGDLAPGQSVVATYQISVATDAVTKLYGLDSEIRYRDDIDNTYISDVMKVPVDVENQTGVSGILSNSVAVSVILAAIIGIAYAVWYMRKKQR